MFLTDVTGGTSTAMLEKMLAFTEARNKVIATNIANATTPGYRAKQVDPAAFQAALRDAAARRKADGGGFEIAANDQVEVDAAGMLKVKPTEEPTENLLFHDGTNARIERQMATLAENTMMHNAAVDLLRSKFEGLSKAIRGRAG